MKQFTLLLVALLFIKTSFAQQFPNLVGSNKVTSIGYWSLGQKASYHVVNSSKTYKANADKLQKESNSSYDFEIKVVDSTATTYEFELKYKNFEIENPKNEIEKGLSELQMESVVRYRTDELGVFDTILNLEELNKELVEKLNRSKDLIASTVEDKEMIELYSKIMDNFILKFNELENVEALYLTDIVQIHGYYGIEMVLTKAIDLELLFPTIGDYVVTGTGKLTLNSINKLKDECLFIVNAKPNKEELKEYMASFLLLFMLDGSKKFDFDELDILMSQKTKLKMELSSGWMLEVSDVSTVKLKDDKREVKKVTSKVYTKV